MIHASLTGTFGPALEVDSASSYRIQGKRLERGHERELLTEHMQDGWSFHGDKHPHLLVLHGIRVHFENRRGEATQPLGPFDQLFVANEHVYGDDELVAQFSTQSNCWRTIRDGRLWSVMVLEELGRA